MASGLQASPLVSFVAADGGSAGGGSALSGQVAGAGSRDSGQGNVLVAGSLIGLSAQDDAAEYVLRASNEQLTRWETALPQATALGEHEYAVIPSGKPGVLGLGKEQGTGTGATGTSTGRTSTGGTSSRSTTPSTGDALLLAAAAVTGAAGFAARAALKALEERGEPAVPADGAHDEEG